MERREAAGEKVFLDWVHPSPLGHQVIAELLAPVVGHPLPARAPAPAGTTTHLSRHLRAAGPRRGPRLRR